MFKKLTFVRWACVCTPGCFAHWQRAAEEQECVRLGHPIGSERCWMGSDGDIAAGEVGTVVGLAATEKGKIVVEFSQGPRQFPSDQLVTVEGHARWVKAVTEEAARLGHPIGSERCLAGSNGDIAAGEVGTVVGLSATEKGKIVVEFGKNSWVFSSDQLISVEEHGRRAKAAAEEAARQRKVQAAADAERRRADEASAAQAAAAETEKREREAAVAAVREYEAAEQRRAREAAARRAREAEAEQRRAREAAARHQGGAAEEPHDAAAMRRQNKVKN